MEAAARQALGAYYTPTALAEPLARWALRQAGDTVLDPSCGDGAFLTCGVDRLLGLGASPRTLPDQIAGVDVDVKAVQRARAALLSRHPALRWGRLAQDDFFLFAQENLGQVAFDAVLGNPPYLRTQGRSEASKRRALEVARRCGAELTADASAWAPFVAAAAGFVKPGGRLAMVVPREALFTNYTRPLLAMLERRFASVNLIALDEYWFEGAIVKVALLLAEGIGPGVLRLHETRDLGNLERLIEAAPAAVPASSWVWSRIPADCRPAAARALESPALRPLNELATILIGVVTGEKDFFLLPEAKVRDLGIPGDYVTTALSRPSQLGGAWFTRRDAAALESSEEPCRLLPIPIDYKGGCMALDGYLARGASDGFDRNYKCRTRKPWYSVRRQLAPPDALLGYLVKRRPRLAANAAAVHSTNNLHRVYLKGPAAGAAGIWTAAALNAATMLSVELLGRIGAAGVLKIEPGDASKIRLLTPETLAKVKGAKESASAIDAALREERDADAFAIADDLASKALGWNPRDMARLRRAQAALRDARLAPA
ncbi:MAG TPA: N-6 DNA methylase [Planctomycetota bacterium]|nr:N-6 DNA methylase [Planctomycetota bacterium]